MCWAIRSHSLGYFGHRLTFGQVLADESVGVLIGPALQAVMRRGEVELDRVERLYLAIPVELGPVVRRDGAHPPGMARQQTEQGAVGLGRSPGLEFADLFPSLHTSSVLHLVCESAWPNQAMKLTATAVCFGEVFSVINSPQLRFARCVGGGSLSCSS